MARNMRPIKYHSLLKHTRPRTSPKEPSETPSPPAIMATCDTMDWVPSLPAEVLSSVTAHLSCGDLSKSSTVNTAWKEAFGRTVQRLKPQGALPHPVCLAERFPELQALFMDDCEGVNITDEQIAQAAGLRYLRELSLAGCQACTDEGLASLAMGAGLQELSLTKCNALTSHTLSLLQASPSLTSLDLGQCTWVNDSSMATISTAPGLMRLSVANCVRLTDAGVQSIAKLRCIKVLDLSDLCEITDDGLQALSVATSLKELILDRCNRIRGSCLGRLHHLRKLSMRHCSCIANDSLSCLSELTSLEELMLDACDSITDEGVSHLSSLHALKSLSLSSCKCVVGEALSELSEVKGLRSLILDNCSSLSRAGIAAVGTLLSLEDLSLRIKYIDMGRKSFQHLSALVQLKSLKLSGCVDVQAEGLCFLAQGCLLLARLDLSGCKVITDESMTALGKMQHLNTLNLNQCADVTDTGAAVLATSPSIRDISVQNTNITAHGLKLLQNALGLRPAPFSPTRLLAR